MRAITTALDRAAATVRLAAIFVETPANPTNALVDIAACADVARAIMG